MAISASVLGASRHQEWDYFVASESHPGGLGNIHQTSKWGLFQQKAKGEGWWWWIVAVFDGDKIIGGGLVMRRVLGMGRGWLYVPKGPIFDYGDPAVGEVIKVWLEAVEELGRQEKAVFLRVEPGLVERGPKDFGKHGGFEWRKFGFVPAHAHYQPENTVVVDLGGTEEEILAKMKAKGRYNIKLAEKKGVKVLVAGEKEISLEKGVEEFHKLLSETTSRDGFSGHPAKYYLEMLKTLGSNQAKLYLAQYDGEIIAGILVTFFGDLAIYYFGASGNKHRNVMAPYLLQWKAMQEAKSRAIRWYDFLGTAPLSEMADGEFSYDVKHSWAGVTEFKLKFGGYKIDFYPGFEKVYQKGFFLLMKLRKKLRRA